MEARRVDLWLATGPRRRLHCPPPALKTSKGTIQLRPDDAAGIPDAEPRDLVRAALEA